MDSDQMLANLQADYGTSRFNLAWQKQDWCYWDNLYMPTAGGRELNFFAQPAGGTDSNAPAGFVKTTEQTNLDTSGQIGGAECFIPMSLHFDLYPAPKVRQAVSAVTTQASFAADQLLAARWLQRLSNQGVFLWEINRNNWMTEALPFRVFPPGFGLGIVIPPAVVGVTDGTPVAINGGQNAYCSMSPFAIFEMGDIFSLDQPVFMAPNTPFTFKIEFPQANSSASTNIYNGAGTAHDQTATFFAYAEMRGIKVRPLQ